MKTNCILYLIVCFVACLLPVDTVYSQQQAPTGLLCNLLSAPELSVITDRQPDFGWIVPVSGQTAYRILVSSSKEKAMLHEGDVWDSGKIKSSQSINVTYKGQSLQPGNSYWWQVAVWDASSKMSAYSNIQQFNTGNWNKPRSWPGESNWVRIAAANGGDSLWTFENRHPITYHHILPVRTVKRKDGTIFYDFGKAAFANAVFDISTHADRDVTVRVGEKAVGDSIDTKPGGGVIFQQYPLLLRKDVHSTVLDIPRFVPHYPHSQAMPTHMPEVIPFRYLEIVALGDDVTINKVEQEALYYFFNGEEASFFSSNDTLNAVYNLCKYSIKANTFNGDYSASQRERMMYEADCYIHQLGTYAVAREYAIARYSLENMIFHATWPTEWILHIPLMAWADYQQTGDMSVIARYYEEIKPKTLLALSTNNDLISTRTGLMTEEVLRSIHFNGKELRDIVDWPHGSMSNALKGGETDAYDFHTYNTVVNAFHYQSLVLMGQMAEALGKKADVAFYREKSKRVKEAFNKYFLDKTSGIYTDGIENTHSSLHANMFALVFGLVPDTNKEAVVAFIKSKDMACGVYGANYLLEALYNAGEANYALSLMTSGSDRSWVNMLRVGATMTTEAWDNKYKSNNGWSHAWSSSPAHIIPRKLMGIEPLEPGFGKIRIKPQPAGLRQAQASLPTIRGQIQVAFEQEPNRFFEMNVTIPGNTVAEIWLPLPAKKYKLSVDGEPAKGTVDGQFVKVLVKGNNMRLRIE